MIEHFSIFQPNAWDNSIVPINIIHKLINEVNNLIDIINEMEDESFERSKEYTDEQVNVINSRLAYIDESFDVVARELSRLSTNIYRVDNRESEHYTTIQNQITALNEYVASVRLELKNYTDINILNLKRTLESEINEIKRLIDNLVDVETIDGLTGTKKTIREILASRIVGKIKRASGNRYALTWSQISVNTKNGWLAYYSQRYYGNINYFAPTWYNFKKNNYEFSSGQTSSLYGASMNTWGAFCNNTLLFIGELVHNMYRYYTASTQAIADNFKSIDVFDYADWSGRLSDPETTVELSTETDISGLYDGANTIASLIRDQFKKSVDIFTGFVSGYGLYSGSATSTNALFAGTTDIPRMIQYLQGNMNSIYDSNTYYRD